MPHSVVSVPGQLVTWFGELADLWLGGDVGRLLINLLSLHPSGGFLRSTYLCKGFLSNLIDGPEVWDCIPQILPKFHSLSWTGGFGIGMLVVLVDDFFAGPSYP